MTTTRLSVSMPKDQKVEATKRQDEGVRANTDEAMRLYKRGVAAARGGQKRIAAGLLMRSVQYDPNSEGAWLWLSGVLEDPHQIAFCLHSVLKLNPGSERARKGLRWLEERQLLKGDPKPTTLFEVKVGEAPVVKPAAQEQQESWWVQWRQTVQSNHYVNMLLWSVPLLLVFLALILNQAFVTGAQNAQTRPVLPSVSNAPTAAVASVPVVPDVPPTATPEAILNRNPAVLRQSQMMAYLSGIEPIRAELQAAVEQYRSKTGKPGNAAIAHTSAAQELRNSVQQAYTTMQAMTPPAELQKAHAEYLQGLELELEAIDAIAEFYGSYQTNYANLAAVRFQDANAHFAQARAGFDSVLKYVEMNSAVSVHSVR